ncbi:cerebellin-2-like [Engraulis encrasicolus]|uniref:cerebellin-2-like n=1 Tax=Engraulis encrasicolus TaxID=184585 RepID=UPI002FD69D92
MKSSGAVMLLLWLVVCVGAADLRPPQDDALMTEMRKELRAAKEALQVREQPRVAFSLSFAVNEDKHIGPFDQDTTLIFNFPFVNVGNHYDTVKGVFTVPRCGVYQFHYHVFAGGDHGAGAKLEVNGNHMVSAYNHKAPHDINTSQTVLLDLKTGDRVCLRLEKGWWLAAYTAHPTTFSGMLLFEAPTITPVA